MSRYYVDLPRILSICVLAAIAVTGCVPPAATPGVTVTASPSQPVKTPTAAVTAPATPPATPTVPPKPSPAFAPPAVAIPSPPPTVPATPRPTSAAGTAPAATPGPALAAQAQAGRAVFSQNCARCHGASGEGVIGPRLIGEGQNLAFYGKGDGLFDFVSKGMPMDAPGTLPREDYLNVLAFILQSNGYLQASSGPLTADSLAGIPLAK
ncbi:MAG: cytochrome c [Chloroflexi bacterium]|nr:cytochrome c [Chloroflexota bacterium]